MGTQERDFYIFPGTVQRAAAGRGHRPHPRALQRPRLRPGPGGAVRHPDRPREGVGDHPDRGRGGAPVPRRRRGHHRDRRAARRGDPAPHRPQAQRRLLAVKAARERAGDHGPLRRHRARRRRRLPGRRPGPREPPHQPGLRDHRGPGGLRRTHQHQRQHPERGEDPAPRDPDGGGGSLHHPEAGPGPPEAREPQLLRAGQRHHHPRLQQGKDRRQHRRDREAHRHLLHRRRLQLRRWCPRHPQPVPAELPRPRVDRLPPDRRRRERPERHAQLYRALAVRSPAVGGLRPLQQPARVPGLHRELARRRHQGRATPSASTRAGTRSTG